MLEETIWLTYLLPIILVLGVLEGLLGLLWV
jgi:hypothetical protein